MFGSFERLKIEVGALSENIIKLGTSKDENLQHYEHLKVLYAQLLERKDLAG